MTSKVMLLIGIVFGMVFATGCAPKTLRIEYVLPNRFTGIVKLIAESPGGISIAAKNQKLQLKIPDSGVLKLQGKLPTFEFHRTVVRYEDGSGISVSKPESPVDDEQVAFRALGVKNDNKEAWFLVGTTSELKNAMTDFYGFEIP